MYRIVMTVMTFLSCLLISNLALAAEAGTATTAKDQRLTRTASALEGAALPLFARGPGALFTSIDAAAVDALTYAYLQARAACDAEFMRGGTIHPAGDGYFSYSETHRADRWSRHQISYVLKPQDVARFHLYPVNRDSSVNRINERPSRVDRRSVSAVDPLHRPLYILHPSLAIRAYRGERAETVEVANLRSPVQPSLFAAKCSTQAPSLGGLSDSNRVAETNPPLPRY